MRSSLLIAAPLLLVASLAPAAEITLREEASVASGPLLRLSDVARVEGRDAARLGAMALMPTPAPGSQQFLSAASIRSMLAAQGEGAGVHRFRGAYRVRVATPSKTVVETNRQDSDWQELPTPSRSSAKTAFRIRGRFDREAAAPQTRTFGRRNVRNLQAVKAAVMEAVRSTIASQRGSDALPRLAVRDVQLSETALRELAELDVQGLTVALPSGRELTPGAVSMRLWPESRLNDEAFRIVADLVEQPMRVVATTPVARGELITASAVRPEPVPVEEIGRPTAQGYATVEAVLGKEAKRNLRIGDIVSETNTAPPVMVRRGEEVDVVSGGGGVSVSMRAIAKQDGRAGELITISMIDRKEQLMARVVGYRRLAVLSGGPAVADLTLTGGLR